MAVRFSWVISFMSSYFFSILVKRGKTTIMPMMSPSTMTGSATANTTARSALMEIAMPSASASMTGARTSTLMTIM